MKLSIFALSLVLAPLFCQAQDFRRHEIGLSASFGNQADPHFYKYIDSFGDLEANGNVFGEYFGFTLDYTYNLTKKWSLGFSAGWAKNYSGLYSPKYEGFKPGEETLEYSFKSNMWHFMPSLRYNWLHSKATNLYSLASLGVAHLSNTCERTLGRNGATENDYWVELDRSNINPEKKLVFAYQATLFGAEVGNHGFRFFTELGWGYKGVVVIGSRYAF